MKNQLKELYSISLTCEQNIPPYIKKLERQRDRLEERLDTYESKDYLTDAQEEKRDVIEDKISELEDEIDTLENVISYVEDIVTELAGYFPDKRSFVLPATIQPHFDTNKEHNYDDTLESMPELFEEKRPSTLVTAIKAVIATELTLDTLKNKK